MLLWRLCSDGWMVILRLVKQVWMEMCKRGLGDQGGVQLAGWISRAARLTADSSVPQARKLWLP